MGRRARGGESSAQEARSEVEETAKTADGFVWAHCSTGPTQQTKRERRKDELKEEPIRAAYKYKYFTGHKLLVASCSELNGPEPVDRVRVTHLFTELEEPGETIERFAKARCFIFQRVQRPGEACSNPNGT